MGIFFGLQDFNVQNVTESIPNLLNGLKTAFLTSLVGIFLSFIFERFIEIKLHKVEKANDSKDELSALNSINSILKEILIKQNETKSFDIHSFENIINRNFDKLNKSLIGDNEDSISTQLFKIRNSFNDLELKSDRQIQAIEKVQSLLGGDSETSLLTQLQKLRVEQNEYSKLLKDNINWIVENMDKNSQLMSQKFDEFVELLAKNNTEALVEVMKKATEEFNSQMSELINKLVKENFDELNRSVQNMNNWQKENKEMIISLTGQFKDVSDNFKVSSESIKEITINTTTLTDKNSYLSKLIQELQRVMIDDNKFEQISDKLLVSTNALEKNSVIFENSGDKLILASTNLEKNSIEFDKSTDRLIKSSSTLDENIKVFDKSTELLSKNVDSLTISTNSLNSSTENLETISKLSKDNNEKLSKTIDTLKSNTLAFEESTNKLNEWVRSQMNFTESVAKLLVKLEDVEKIKDINELFWNETKKGLNEAVGLIAQANKNLEKDIKEINQEFYERLNTTFSTLDELFSSMLDKRY